jgi:hypothetical protein
MDNSALIAKFQQLPERLKQQVIDIVDGMLSQIKRGDSAMIVEAEGPLPNVPDTVQWISHNNKLLPVTPASEEPDIKALFGIWNDNTRTVDELRKAAWGDRI